MVSGMATTRPTAASVRRDLVDEQNALDAIVADLTTEQWALPTGSPRWSVADQIAHLTFFDETAAWAVADEDRFRASLDELGPAFLNDGAIFMYGPPGTGKTSLAERMIRIHKDAILIPHAVEMDGQVITLFDPAVHAPVPEQPPGLDPRWILCARPIVIVGGELTLDMVDLELDEGSGTYKAPIQMQANNGILVVGTPSTCRQFKPGSDDFDVDERSPAYRRFTLHADGSSNNELIWVDD